MPSKYRIRNYTQNSSYHISSLGLGGSEVFLEEEDYKQFLKFLESSLNDRVQIIAHLLLPTHYHLLLKQKDVDGISKVMKRLINSYTYYFNNKYRVSGPKFAGKFKSVKIEEIELAVICRYLHTHPGILWLSSNFKSYPWSKVSIEISFDHSELDKKTLAETKHLLLD